MTLTGSAFVAGMVLDFGGVNVTPTSAAVLATGRRERRDLGASAFVYTMGPTISSIVPNNGAPGSIVTITGTGFRAGTVDCPETGLRNVDNASANFTPPSFAGNVIFPAGVIAVDSNDYVGRDGLMFPGEPNNQVLPSNVFLPYEALIPFWDDLDNSPTIGQVYVAERDVLGVNTLIVQWDGFARSDDIGNATFQVQIHENGAAGGVLASFAYADVVFGDPASDGGASATIGFQDLLHDQFSFDPGSAVVVDGDLITLIPTNGGGNVVDFTQTNDPSAFVDIARDSDVYLTWSGGNAVS